MSASRKYGVTDNPPPFSMEREATYSDMTTKEKGLTNLTGQNNCFLNSVVQVLWHVDEFRRKFRIIQRHQCVGADSGNCIVCALQIIFTQFQYSDSDSLPPDQLRKAMAATFSKEERFQLGRMDDAAECYEKLLSRIHRQLTYDNDEDRCDTIECLAHNLFAMKIREQARCLYCSHINKLAPTTNQMICYISASAIIRCNAAGRKHTMSGGAQNYKDDFGLLLKEAMKDDNISQHCRNCNRDITSEPEKHLASNPAVVTIGLVWEHETTKPDTILCLLASIDDRLKLSNMFDKSEVADRPPMSLVAVLCYYGKHYSSFLYRTKKKTWISADDSNVKDIGSSWLDVVDKCERGRYQPLLLVYAYTDDHVDRRMDTKGGQERQRRSSRPSPDDSYYDDGRSSGNASGKYPTGSSSKTSGSSRVTSNGMTGRTSTIGRSGTDDIGIPRQPSYLAAVGSSTSSVPDTSSLHRPMKRPQTATGLRSSTDCPPQLQDGTWRRGDQMNRRNAAPNPRTASVSVPKPEVSSTSGSLKQWIECNGSDDDDSGGQYIDRGLVKNVLWHRRVLATNTSSVQPFRPVDVGRSGRSHSEADGNIYGSTCSIAEDFCRTRRPFSSAGFESLKLEVPSDNDRDSGISGDRNSASSTSSGLSTESSSIESSLLSLVSSDEYPAGEGGGASSSSTMSCSSSSLEKMNCSSASRTAQWSLGLSELARADRPRCGGTVQAYDAVPVNYSQRTSSTALPSDGCLSNRDRASRNSAQEVVRPPVPTKSLAYRNADEWCKQLLLDAESHIEKSGECEKSGDLTQAIQHCHGAIDLLKTAEVACNGNSDASQDLLIHVRMKHNASVLALRRLQRLITCRGLPQQRPTTSPSPAAKVNVRPTPTTNTDVLSKEEVGEILVQEIECRRVRTAAKDQIACPVKSGVAGRCLPQPSSSLPVARDTSGRTTFENYEDMVRKQLKTFTSKGNRNDDVTNGDVSVIADQNKQNVRPSSAVSIQQRSGNSTTVSHTLRSDLGDDAAAARYGNLCGARRMSTGQLPTDDTAPASAHSTYSKDSILKSSSSDVVRPSFPDSHLCNNNAALSRSIPDLMATDTGTLTRAPPTGGTIGRKKKSVTFCDNVYEFAAVDVDYEPSDDCFSLSTEVQTKGDASTLISSGQDVPSGDDCLDRESDGTSVDDSDEAEIDELSADGRPRCDLCRRKWVDVGNSTYCLDCRAYMSRLQCVS